MKIAIQHKTENWKIENILELAEDLEAGEETWTCNHKLIQYDEYCCSGGNIEDGTYCPCGGNEIWYECEYDNCTGIEEIEEHLDEIYEAQNG